MNIKSRKIDYAKTYLTQFIIENEYEITYYCDLVTTNVSIVKGACSDPQPHPPNFFQTYEDFGTKS